jgi:hypothetical protein
MGDDDAESISLIENVHRADLSQLDKARALNALYQRYGSYQRVSKEVAWSPTTIERYVQLLSLPQSLQARLHTKHGPAGVGTLATLAKTFHGEAAIEVYEKISPFKQSIQETIIKQSQGDLSRIADLVEQAQEGAFDTRRCGGRYGCEIIRDIIEGEISRSEFEHLVTEIARELGEPIKRRRGAARDFWKALARS